MPYKDLYVHQVEDFVKQPGAVVIDIRDIHTYHAGHMEGAQHVDGPVIGNLVRQRKTNPPVLVYCYHGNSSRDVAEMISRMGITKVSHLVGGWDAWVSYRIQSNNNRADFDSDLAGALT